MKPEKAGDLQEILEAIESADAGIEKVDIGYRKQGGFFAAMNRLMSGNESYDLYFQITVDPDVQVERPETEGDDDMQETDENNTEDSQENSEEPESETSETQIELPE